MKKLIASNFLFFFLITLSVPLGSANPLQNGPSDSSPPQNLQGINPKVLAFRKSVENEIKTCFRKCEEHSATCKEEVVLRSRKDKVWHAFPHESGKSEREWDCGVLWRPTEMYHSRNH